MFFCFKVCVLTNESIKNALSKEKEILLELYIRLQYVQYVHICLIHVDEKFYQPEWIKFPWLWEIVWVIVQTLDITINVAVSRNEVSEIH